jgi:hypothetical protein
MVFNQNMVNPNVVAAKAKGILAEHVNIIVKPSSDMQFWTRMRRHGTSNLKFKLTL